MSEEWTDKEKQIIRVLGKRQFEPGDPESLRAKVMAGISAGNKTKSVVYPWMNIAAGVLIVVMVGLYVFEEGYTGLKRIKLIAGNENKDVVVMNDSKCGNIIGYYLKWNSRYNVFGVNNDTVYLSSNDFSLLKKRFPGHVDRINNFMFAVKTLYPNEYRRLQNGDVIMFDVNALKGDNRFCELLEKNKSTYYEK